MDMVRMKRCQWDASIELVCINLGESATPGAKRFFQNACHFCHTCHPSKLSQLWDSGGSFGIKPATLLPLLPHLPLSCRFGVFFDELEALQHSAVTSLESRDSEDVPDGVVAAVCADRVETVECAPVFVGGVEDGAVDLVVWSRKPGRTPLGRCL